LPTIYPEKHGNMKIAIIGAGPAGLTAAYELSREIGGKVIVFDAFSTTHSTTIIEKIKD